MLTTIDYCRAIFGNLPASIVPRDGISVVPIGDYATNRNANFTIFSDNLILKEGVDNQFDIIIRSPKGGFQGKARIYLENIFDYDESYFDVKVNDVIYETNLFSIKIRNSQGDEFQREILVCSALINYNKNNKEEYNGR